MADYRNVHLTFPGGRRDTLVVEEGDYYPELMALQRLYGIKWRIGRRIPRGMAKIYDAVHSQKAFSRKGAKPARPLSPDFGRGSGAPT